MRCPGRRSRGVDILTGRSCLSTFFIRPHQKLVQAMTGLYPVQTIHPSFPPRRLDGAFSSPRRSASPWAFAPGYGNSSVVSGDGGRPRWYRAAARLNSFVNSTIDSAGPGWVNGSGGGRDGVADGFGMLSMFTGEVCHAFCGFRRLSMALCLSIASCLSMASLSNKITRFLARS